MLRPDEFIASIKKLDQCWKFTQDISARAHRELAEQDSLPDGFKVNLNVFPQSVASGEILRLLEQEHLRDGRFQYCLEITEDEQLTGDKVNEILLRLNKGGYRIAIDDFGTGYSNLKQIKNFHCYYLKIDRSYVIEIEDGSIRSSLVPHIVQISQDLGLEVVAEGVESTSQRNTLVEIGVRFGQGWLFGKPSNAANLADKVKSAQFSSANQEQMALSL